MCVLSMHGSTAFYTLNLIISYRYTQTNLTNTFYNNVHDMYSCFHLNCTNNSDCAQSHHIHWSADNLCHNGHHPLTMKMSSQSPNSITTTASSPTLVTTTAPSSKNVTTESVPTITYLSTTSDVEGKS